MSHKWERVFFMLRVTLNSQSQRDYQTNFLRLWVIKLSNLILRIVWYCVLPSKNINLFLLQVICNFC